jgi:hypothetical protein
MEIDFLMFPTVHRTTVNADIAVFSSFIVFDHAITISIFLHEYSLKSLCQMEEGQHKWST